MQEETIDAFIIRPEGFDDLILLNPIEDVKDFGYVYASDVDRQVYRVYYTSRTPWSGQKPLKIVPHSGTYSNAIYHAQKARSNALYWYKLKRVRKGDTMYQMHGAAMVRVTVEKRAGKKIYFSNNTTYTIDKTDIGQLYPCLFNTELNTAHYEAYLQKRKEGDALIEQARRELIEKIKDTHLTVNQIKMITHILTTHS